MRGLSVMRLATLVRSNVDRQLAPNARRGETGAVAMLIAILLGTGVLLGAAAITIDTGSLLYERRQLQSGADAVALSIAQTCVAADKAHSINSTAALCAAPDITTSPPSTLVLLAGANAADQTSDIASVCGSAALVAANPSAFPTQCTDWLASPTPPDPEFVQCPKTSSKAKYVEVRTSTRTGTGGTILPPFLAQALAGGTYSGETVKACARVAWGHAGPPGPVLPVAFSACEWAAATGFKPDPTPPATTPPGVPAHYELPPTGAYPGYGPGLTPWPPTADATLNPPRPASELVLYNKGKDAPPSCTTWNNHVAPGTFGELPQTGCNATITDNWVQAANGNPEPCDSATLGTFRGKIVFIPIFDCYTPIEFNFTNCNSTNPADWYHISGYAAFYMTGFYFSSGGKDGESIYPPDGKNYQPCKTVGDRCISGWFTTGTLQTTIDDSGGPDFGASAVQVAG